MHTEALATRRPCRGRDHCRSRRAAKSSTPGSRARCSVRKQAITLADTTIDAVVSDTTVTRHAADRQRDVSHARVARRHARDARASSDSTRCRRRYTKSTIDSMITQIDSAQSHHADREAGHAAPSEGAGDDRGVQRRYDRRRTPSAVDPGAALSSRPVARHRRPSRRNRCSTRCAFRSRPTRCSIA